MRLANLTWPKVQAYFEHNDMVLIAIGSIECHGRHMPLGTDTLIPDHLLEMIEEKSGVLIAPTVPYGSCQSLSPYPGTIDIGSEVLYQFFRQVLENLYRHGARKFVVLNGHGGNVKMIERVGMDLEKQGCMLAMLNWWLMAWDMDPAWKGTEILSPDGKSEDHRLPLGAVQGGLCGYHPQHAQGHRQRLDRPRPSQHRHRGVGKEDAADLRGLYR